jgi:hypothetical protein
MLDRQVLVITPEGCYHPDPVTAEVLRRMACMRTALGCAPARCHHLAIVL